MSLPDDLAITVRVDRKHPCLELQGVVDVTTVPQLRKLLLGLTEDGHKEIEIDLRGVELLDSTGIGALAEAYRNGASLTLRNPSPMAMRQLVMSGVDRIFRIK
jgi:anti-anti-sigma factor